MRHACSSYGFFERGVAVIASVLMPVRANLMIFRVVKVSPPGFVNSVTLSVMFGHFLRNWSNYVG